ncbi:MAG: NAD(P)/FAD-dependent oxidoreductase [Sphingobacteriales bacterium]|nr:NAD(P)/FAD-dependent oxidoreductase [Sphingobacteriales bacterium]
MNRTKTFVIIGGGAAGFFAAVTAAENNPDLDILILEQGNEVLGKVKISGGGRCNVTHACFDVRELSRFYPRGSKELTGPFYRFNCEHTIQWFESRGVSLKTEEDGRIFPITDNSQTIVDCLLEQAKKSGIRIIRQAKVTTIVYNGQFTVKTIQHEYKADFLLLASGGSSLIWNLMPGMGHTIVSPVPSLFSFNTKNTLFKDLSGVSVPHTQLTIKDTPFSAEGILLITHTGISGPGILKLSAFAARVLAEKNYRFTLLINWINCSKQEAITAINTIKSEHAKKEVRNYSPFQLASRFWRNCLKTIQIDEHKQWANLSKNELQGIADFITAFEIPVSGKSTNKDEFVTAGGISLKEVDFKTMESKIIPHLYFAGEVLDIDAVTGGFNFQAAWTTGYIAGTAIGENSKNQIQ